MTKKKCNFKEWWKKNNPLEITSIICFFIFLFASISIYYLPIRIALGNNEKVELQTILNFVFYTFQTTSVLVAVINIARVSRESTRSKEYNKKEYSFDFVRSWDSPNFLNARDFSRKIKNNLDKEKDKELIAEIKHNPELRSAVILLFNFADNARLGLVNYILDPDIIKNLAPALIAILTKYETYMREEEWPQKDDRELYKNDFTKTIKTLKELISTKTPNPANNSV